MSRKTCYYEVLDVDEDADDKALLKAYRKAAMKWHPDKHHQNNLTPEEATEKFQELREAYETLSDPQERAFYDGHKEQILSGQANIGGEPTQGEDPAPDALGLYRHLSSGCFRGFGNDDKGFYAVFSKLFAAIHALEIKEKARDSSLADPPEQSPEFGGDSSPWELTNAFYTYWGNFVSVRACRFAEKWRLSDAPDRFVKRKMEQENKKTAQKARKEHAALVKQLVAFAKRHDPRVARARELQEEEQKRKAAEAERKAAEHAERVADARAEARRLEELRWAEAEAAEAAEASQSEGEGDVWECLACGKSFTTKAAMDNHRQSKKHKKEVAKHGVPESELVIGPDDASEAASEEEGDGEGEESGSEAEDKAAAVAEGEPPAEEVARPTDEPATVVPDEPVCTICDKVFKSDAALEAHLQSKQHRQAQQKAEKAAKKAKPAPETAEDADAGSGPKKGKKGKKK